MGLAGFRWEEVSVFSPQPAPLQAPAWGLPDLTGRLVELSAGAAAAHLTAAFGLVLEAQLRDDRAAWVTLEHSSFFPPDVIDTGVDLDALAVIRVPDARIAGRAADQLIRSGGFGLVVVDLSTAIEPAMNRNYRDRPTRSPVLHGGQGLQPLVSRDESRRPARRTPGAEAGLHNELPRAEAPGLHGQISQGHTRALPVPLLSRLFGLARQHDAVVLLLTTKSDADASMHSLISLRAEAVWRQGNGRYELCVRVLKDKRGGPGWTHVEACRGPAGLR